MDLPVEYNSKRIEARVEFADKRNLAFLAEWTSCVKGDSNPIRCDAVEFAQLAIHRVEAHSAIQPYAMAISDFGDHIRTNPHTEVAGFVLLRCNWFPDSTVIGISHFRRTWANNFVLDYLATHPFIAKPPSGTYGHKVRGVGRALLYFICQLASQYGSKCVWGEATQLSCGFYEKVLELPPLTDVIHVPRERVIRYIERFDEEWRENASPVVAANSALDRVNEVEAQHPPFVGSTTAVFNPRRRLASRFLELPFHVQREIGQALGLLEERDGSQAAPDFYRCLFQRATDRELLPQLWIEVSRRRLEWQLDANPFARS